MVPRMAGNHKINEETILMRIYRNLIEAASVEQPEINRTCHYPVINQMSITAPIGDERI